MPKKVVAVAWLSKEDWPAWQSIDSELPPYDVWLSKLTTVMTTVSAQGVASQKVAIEPETHRVWCDGRGLTVGRQSRARFAAEEQMRKSSSH